VGVAVDGNLSTESTPTTSSTTKVSKDHQVFLEGIQAQMQSREAGFQKATTDVISSIKSFAS